MSLSTVDSTPGTGLISEHPKGLESDTTDLPYIPNELINEIAYHLEKADICNLRLASRRMLGASEPAFRDAIVNNVTIYARYDSLSDFLLLLAEKPEWKSYVRSVCLVSDGMKEHQYGYSWAWENLEHWENVRFADKDFDLIDDINDAHTKDLVITTPFINSGGYRAMLHQIFYICPKLKNINVRKLKPGEHVPGWVDLDKFRKLSFFREGMDTNSMFYGDWQYDLKHFRVTMYEDEFGDIVAEPGAGPQASFADDVYGAVYTSGTRANIHFHNTK